MKCPNCTRETTPLFHSQACDYCDYGMPEEKLFHGFISYDPDADSGGCDEYVFRTRMDAERWRVAAGRTECSIRKVYSLVPFKWILSRGTLRDVVLADHMFKIFKDHRHEPLPHRAFLGELDG